ncbi:MAG: hypothetical protein K2Q18_05050 [Bdellovibrionales bacterium]|nr:hypothetical protein [Bdellovibrionales bacterium]
MTKVFLIGFLFLSVSVSYAGVEEILGLGSIGDKCESDYGCSSLCCDANSGMCEAHDLSVAIKCNKQSGETCVTNDFCQSYYITACKLIKITKRDGSPSCTLRCDRVEAKSSCKKNVCIPPETPATPPFDPINPDCSKAI